PPDVYLPAGTLGVVFLYLVTRGCRTVTSTRDRKPGAPPWVAGRSCRDRQERPATEPVTLVVRWCLSVQNREPSDRLVEQPAPQVCGGKRSTQRAKTETGWKKGL